MRRLWVLAVAVPLLLAACGSSDETIDQAQVGSTEAAIAATPAGVANCGRYPLPRRMSQYVNIVENDALPELVANPIDSTCRLAVATLIESVPECAEGTPETTRRSTRSARRCAARSRPAFRPNRRGRSSATTRASSPAARPAEPSGRVRGPSAPSLSSGARFVTDADSVPVARPARLPRVFIVGV